MAVSQRHGEAQNGGDREEKGIHLVWAMVRKKGRRGPGNKRRGLREICQTGLLTEKDKLPQGESLEKMGQWTVFSKDPQTNTTPARDNAITSGVGRKSLQCGIPRDQGRKKLLKRRE